MKRNLLQFLFQDSQEQSAIDALGDEFAELLAEADEAEEIKPTKTPLITALSGLDIGAGDLEMDTMGFLFVTDKKERYDDVWCKLQEPDQMHKLAEQGWIAVRCEDTATQREEPAFTIRFIEITTVETSDAKRGEAQKAIVKKAREFATTPVDREDDFTKPKGSGVGKATDGKTPESTKESAKARQLADTLLSEDDEDNALRKEIAEAAKRIKRK